MRFGTVKIVSAICVEERMKEYETYWAKQGEETCSEGICGKIPSQELQSVSPVIAGHCAGVCVQLYADARHSGGF